MKSVRLLLLCLVCAGVCAAQDAPTTDATAQAVPPGLVILKFKWERQVLGSLNWDRPLFDASIPIGDPNSSRGVGGGLALPRRRPPYLYQYSVEIRNDGAKQIRWVSWEYILNDPGSKQELGRHKFASREKISPAKKKTLRGQTSASPSRIVSAAGLGKDRSSPYDERVEFRCVKYDDGTWWHQPSVQDSECAEAEQREKSRRAARRP